MNNKEGEQEKAKTFQWVNIQTMAMNLANLNYQRFFLTHRQTHSLFHIRTFFTACWNVTHPPGRIIFVLTSGIEECISLHLVSATIVCNHLTLYASIHHGFFPFISLSFIHLIHSFIPSFNPLFVLLTKKYSGETRLHRAIYLSASNT